MFGNDTRNERSWRYVERRIVNRHAVGSGRFAKALDNLTTGTLFDGDFTSSGDAEIKCARGRGDIKWNAMGAGQHRDTLRANLVGRVAVSRDAVGSRDHSLHLARLHHMAGHVVANQRAVDISEHKFERRKPCTLQQRPSFVDPHPWLLTPAGEFKDYRQRCAITTGGQRARIAVRENSAASRQVSK